MGLLDAYADTMERNTLSALRRPGPIPAEGFNLWAAGKSPVAGALDAVAGMTDFLNLSGFSNALGSLEGGPGGDAAAAAMRAGITDTKQGAAIRRKADEFMPDPLTAHWSTQAVAGLTRFASKAVVDVSLLGPVAGATVLGLDEGNNAAQRLIEKGIDPATAAKVGAVEGTLSAVGAVLPVVGQTVVKTVALVAAGGPLSFMAQQGLSREILQRANYGAEAALRDPLDPVGLAISTLVPAGFGAYGLRAAAKRAGAINGSLKNERDMKAAAALTPEEQAHSDAFEASAANLAELRAAVAAEKRPEQRAILQQELTTQEAAAARMVREGAADRGAADPARVDAARVAVLDETVARSLPDHPAAHAEMARAMDAVAAGERTDDIPDFGPRPATLQPVASVIDDLRIMGEGATWAQEGGRLLRSGTPEPGDQGMGGAPVGRTTWIPAQEWYGRMRRDLGRDGLTSKTEIQGALEKAAAGEKLSARESRTVNWMREEHAQMQSEIARRMGDVDSGPIARDALGAGLGSRDAEQVSAVARAAEYDEAALERAAIQHENDDAAFMAEVWRINAYGQEQDRASGITRASADESSAPARAAPREQGTNALPRADEALEPAAPRTAAADKSPEAQQAENMAALNPDMQVRLPGSERAGRIADALEQIRAERQQDAQMAELLKAAVACALTGGAAT